MSVHSTETTVRKRLPFNSCHRQILILGIILILSVFVTLGIGRFHVPFVQTVKIVLARICPSAFTVTWTDQMENVVLSIRLPRVLGAGLVGGALAISGATYQGLFKNPLVSPDLLGVSNGATVGASVAILLGLTSFQIQLFALATGLLAVLLTTRIPRFFHNTSNLMLVLAGIICSGFMTAVQGILKYVADPETQLAEIVYWTMGSLASVHLSDVWMAGVPIVVCIVILVLMRWRINLLSLGDHKAKALGVNVKGSRAVCIVCSTVLTASAVSICGTIGWVGLVVPHMSRLMVGEDNRYVIPNSVLCGAVFMILVDTVARNMGSSEIPLSILTGLVGTPLFLWLLAKQKARIN